MPNGEAFIKAIETSSRLVAPSARATFEANRDLSLWLLDPLAGWAYAAYGDRAFEDAARGYAKYCLGVAQMQRNYEKTGRYAPKGLSEVAAEVYEDEGYMVPYMWAAILIYPLWPSMIRHLALYRDEFLAALPPQARLLELASGHGVMSLLAAEERSDLQVHGIDISPPAVAVANRLLSVSGHGGRVRFEVKNALDLADWDDRPQYDGIIAAMLAEHLEDPEPLFKAISHHLAEDGIVFFSTAIESAQADHIYEFHQESEPVKMAEDVGLRVIRLISDAGVSARGARFLPRATALVLRRR